MEDPLRHAVGMRTAQVPWIGWGTCDFSHSQLKKWGLAKDQYKMQMWNSFPSLFQNTIFHGEQDLRCANQASFVTLVSDQRASHISAGCGDQAAAPVRISGREIAASKVAKRGRQQAAKVIHHKKDRWKPATFP